MVSSEVIRGFIDSIILDVLREKDNYGYEVSKQIELKTKGNFLIKEATLYASFKRLENKGLLYAYMGDETHGGKRKYYQLTREGLKYLDEKKDEWKETRRIIDVFLGEGHNEQN